MLLICRLPSSVSTTLITRLMLNIRDPKLRWGVDSTDSDISSSSRVL